MSYDYNLQVKNGLECAVPYKRIKQITKQLMLNEIELSYWHALNIEDPTIWEDQTGVLDHLLQNAVAAKCLCNPPEIG